MAGSAGHAGVEWFYVSSIGVLLALEQGQVGHQLQIDHGLQAPVDLHECGGLFSGDDFVENGDVADAQFYDLLIGAKGAIDQVGGLGVGDGAVAVRVFLDQRVLRVVDLDEVGGVLVIDGPEFRGFVRGED